MKSSNFGSKYLVLARDMYEAQEWAASQNIGRSQWHYVMNRHSLDGIDSLGGWKAVRLQGFHSNPRSVDITLAIEQKIQHGQILGIVDE